MAATVENGTSLPIGPSLQPMAPLNVETESPSRKSILVFSPHPDDEALIGALPLRLRLESGARVTNCAVTLGSDKSQRSRRLSEVQASCNVLGFGLVVPDYPNGLDGVTCEDREDRGNWTENVQELATIIDTEQPDLILFPHEDDFHPTHVGTHFLALDALDTHLSRSPDKSVMLAMTEYWHQMLKPNLMVGLTAEHEAVLVMAVAEHGGEVTRNPYHIQHPARLIDNVRRGSELVGIPGDPACKFQFAELYRVALKKGNDEIVARRQGIIASPSEHLNLEVLSDMFIANHD
jgi:N-acetylglucosamine malate deacetylase 1